MDQFLTLSGSSALPDFQRQALEHKLGAQSVEAEHRHYVAVSGSREQIESIKPLLQELLGQGDFVENDREEEKRGSDTIYVYPRFGTISPWSSKATSIAQVCGLDVVKRIERGIKFSITSSNAKLLEDALHDRMTQTLSKAAPELQLMFAQHTPAPLQSIPIHAEGTIPQEVLRQYNKFLGLALDDSDIDYLVDKFALDGPIARDPSDAELFMFSQINSEHCRHKQFNAMFTVDGVEKPQTLFGMIRNTHQRSPNHTISAYSDNAAVFEGQIGSFLAPDRFTGEWKQTIESVPCLGKVETHNHPTSVVPYEGAATGSGGEIRDEGAVGRGSRPKSGLCGFSVSDLLIPELQQPWELPDVGYPGHIATSLNIMLEAPIGSAAFNNEFGRYVPTACTRERNFG